MQQEDLGLSAHGQHMVSTWSAGHHYMLTMYACIRRVIKSLADACNQEAVNVIRVIGHT